MLMMITVWGLTFRFIELSICSQAPIISSFYLWIENKLHHRCETSWRPHQVQPSGWLWSGIGSLPCANMCIIGVTPEKGECVKIGFFRRVEKRSRCWRWLCREKMLFENVLDRNVGRYLVKTDQMRGVEINIWMYYIRLSFASILTLSRLTVSDGWPTQRVGSVSNKTNIFMSF